MENIMLPEPHKILSVLKETKAEYTFRVEYHGEKIGRASCRERVWLKV